MQAQMRKCANEFQTRAVLSELDAYYMTYILQSKYLLRCARSIVVSSTQKRHHLPPTPSCSLSNLACPSGQKTPLNMRPPHRHLRLINTQPISTSTLTPPVPATRHITILFLRLLSPTACVQACENISTEALLPVLQPHILKPRSPTEGSTELQRSGSTTCKDTG